MLRLLYPLLPRFSIVRNSYWQRVFRLIRSSHRLMEHLVMADDQLTLPLWVGKWFVACTHRADGNTGQGSWFSDSMYLILISSVRCERNQ